MRRLLIVACALLLTACPPSVDDDDATEPACENMDAPVVLVQGVDDGQPVGFPVQVLAQVTDGDGISTVSLYYRTEGQPNFTFTFMTTDGTGADDVYQAEIPATAVQDPGVDFYVRAKDQVSACQGETVDPVGAPEEAWYHFTTQLDLQPLPYYAFFEPDGECGVEGSQLEDLGWQVGIEEFFESIHAWRLSDRSSLSPSCGVHHSEGIPGGFWECPPPDGAGSIHRDNWLISPPLDLSGNTEIAVRWFERHVEAGICSESHGLYVSTGSPDPAELDYVAVVEQLPFPSDAWQGSAWHDLSQFAGGERVYVALRYQGGAAGAWYVDDLYVGEPLADLQLDEAGPLAASVQPGSSAVELVVSVVNVSAEYGAAALSATLSSADDGLTITSPGSTVAALGPGEAAAVSAPFVFDVAASHPDNAWLDFALTLQDDAGHFWTVPIRQLMGQESTVEVAYTAPVGAELELAVGHGPAEAPDWAMATTTADLGGAPWSFDVTSEAAMLPPGPGSFRWHLRATNTGTVAATLDSLVFVVGGLDYLASAADVPATLEPGQQLTILVPPPPEIVVESWTSDPDPPAPGAAVTLSDVTIRNDGSTTSDQLGCVMGSSHDHADGFDSVPVTFGTDPIDEGASQVADGSFSFTIDGAHIDDSPLPLTLLCTDGADTITHTFDLPVPYAHPIAASIRIDDEDCDECDEDGLADASETVQVFVTAINDGAFVTGDPVIAGVVDTVTGSATDYTFVPETLEFGVDPLEPGVPVESSNSFEITLGDDARLGDSIVLELAWTSGSDVWTEELVVEVTGLPWTDCPEGEDLQGDVVNGYSFDIKGCAFRSDGVRLQVRLDSWTPIDPTTAFVDFIFYEVPFLYSVETIGGVPDFEDGCVFGDNLPADEIEVPEVSVGGMSVTARIRLDDIIALGGNTQVAFGAGSCPDVYFCDTYPENVLLFNVAEGQYNCDGNGFMSLNW
jgi:hypothetical protein